MNTYKIKMTVPHSTDHEYTFSNLKGHIYGNYTNKLFESFA